MVGRRLRCPTPRVRLCDDSRPRSLSRSTCRQARWQRNSFRHPMLLRRHWRRVS